MDYDDLAAAYAAHRRAHPPVLAALADGLSADARVLEVGCGTGSYSGALNATGLDPSREMLAVELERYPPPARLHEALARAGFDEFREQRAEWRVVVDDIGPFRDKALSSLHLIPEDAFRRGLERLERDLPLEAVDRKVLLWSRKGAARGRVPLRIRSS